MRKLWSVIIAATFALASVNAQTVRPLDPETLSEGLRLYEAITTIPDADVPRPGFGSYWTKSLKTDININQTGLYNWAAGGDNTFSLAAYVDGQANMKYGSHLWNNRLQLDFGLLYSSSKPIAQKNTDRIYFESRYGFKVAKTLYVSANYDFKTQFTTGYKYNTPSADIIAAYDPSATSLDGLSKADRVKAWKDARQAVSDFLSPGYTNLALGIDYKPKNWLSVNLAPLTGDLVIVVDPKFRKSYGMEVRSKYASLAEESLSWGEDLTQEQQERKQQYESLLASGQLYNSTRFGLGAQVKVDASVSVNDNFSCSTQLVLFENYLKDHKAHPCPRINWDNRVNWKLSKYFTLTFTTNLIYDDTVMIKSDDDLAKFPDGRARVQFRQSAAFGFTYTFVPKV